MLSDTQKAKVRLYLGYPDNFRFKNTRLESVLDNLSPEAEVLIDEYLTALGQIETSITSGSTSAALTTIMAGIKRVDEVWFETGSTATSSSTTNVGFKNLKEAGRFYASRISILTGVPIYSDAFAGRGYLGDDFFPGFGAPINFG